MFAALLLCALPQSALPVQAELDWTLLVYGAADNSSEESFVPDMHFLMQGLSSPGIEVLAFVDRSPAYSDDAQGLGEDFAGARLYRLGTQGPERLPGGEHFPEITADNEYEANSADVESLRKALRWAKATSPAKRYGLVFYSHGNGRSWCPDDSSPGDDLYPAELTDGLEHQDSVDLMVFDVCQMGGIELAYEWRPKADGFGADVMVATPMAGFPFPWREILRAVAASETPTAELDAGGFAQIIVDVCRADRKAVLEGGELPPQIREIVAGEAMGSYDLRQASAVKGAVDSLARELASDPQSRALFEGLRGSGAQPGSLHYLGAQLERGWRSAPNFDLFDLASRVEELEEFPQAVRAAATGVCDAVDAMVLDSYGMDGYDAHGGFQDGRHGLYIVFPDGAAPDGAAPDGVDRTQWQQFRWYQAADLREVKNCYGRYAWCADGAVTESGGVGNWVQLLESWYGAR